MYNRNNNSTVLSTFFNHFETSSFLMKSKLPTMKLCVTECICGKTSFICVPVTLLLQFYFVCWPSHISPIVCSLDYTHHLARKGHVLINRLYSVFWQAVTVLIKCVCVHCIRSMVGVSRLQQWKEKITTRELAECFGMTESMTDILRRHRLRWLGHVTRMDDSQMAKQLLLGELERTHLRHGPKWRWRRSGSDRPEDGWGGKDMVQSSTGQTGVVTYLQAVPFLWHKLLVMDHRVQPTASDQDVLPMWTFF